MQDQQDSKPDHVLSADTWFGVRCIFGHGRREEGNLYEERILLVRSTSLDQAIAKAEQEAQVYADQFDDVTYLNFCQAYDIFDDSLSDGCEMFSLIRSSVLNRQEYLTLHFDTGAELEDKNG